MSRIFRWVCLPALLLGLATGTTFGAPAGLDQVGKPDLKSAGPLAFGPKGVLFVGDPQGAQIFAVDVGTAPTNPIGPTFKLEGADAKIAAAVLGGYCVGPALARDIAGAHRQRGVRRLAGRRADIAERERRPIE